MCKIPLSFELGGILLDIEKQNYDKLGNASQFFLPFHFFEGVPNLIYPQRASFSSSQSRRPQSCRVKSKYHPMSRHSSKKRSLSTSGFGQTLEELDEINMIDDETGETLIESGEKIKSPV